MTAQAFLKVLNDEGLQVMAVESDEFGGLAMLPSTASSLCVSVFRRVADRCDLRVTSTSFVWKVNGLEGADDALPRL